MAGYPEMIGYPMKLELACFAETPEARERQLSLRE
jgi:hypothetical protein